MINRVWNEKSAKGVLEYARAEDPVLDLQLEVPPVLMSWDEDRTASTIAALWPAFAQEIRRRNREAGREKMDVCSLDEEASAYLVKSLQEKLAGEEDEKRKSLLTGILEAAKTSSFSLFNLFGDSYDAIHNSGTADFIRSYCEDSLEIFSYKRGGNVQDVLSLWPDKLAFAGKVEEMNQWLFDHIGACGSRSDLENVLMTYDSTLEFTFDDEVPEGADWSDRLREQWAKLQG